MNVLMNVASYNYILSGQKNIKNAKYGQFGEFFINCSLRSNSVTRQINIDWTKIDGNAKIEKFKCDILGHF